MMVLWIGRCLKKACRSFDPVSIRKERLDSRLFQVYSALLIDVHVPVAVALVYQLSCAQVSV